jgi:hypothetical protein
MSLENMTMSEVKDLLYLSEYLIQSLEKLQERFPDSERLVERLENTSKRIDDSMKYGMHKIEGAMLSFDYSSMNKSFDELLHRRMTVVVSSMDRIGKYIQSANDAHKKSDLAIAKTNDLLDQIDLRIDSMTKDVEEIPTINKQLMMVVGSVGFVAGVIALYMLSFITWLPKPYYATSEQTVLLQMVKDNTLKIDTDSYQNMRVSIDSNAFHSLNKNSTNNTGEKQ